METCDHLGVHLEHDRVIPALLRMLRQGGDRIGRV